MSKTYRPYEPEQMLLMPPSVKEWLPTGHLAHFVSELVEESLDLKAITEVYEREDRGYPPYHPAMMTQILLYAYCIGTSSSRKIAKGLLEDVAFRMLAANNTPDFRTISDFRKRHLAALNRMAMTRSLLPKPSRGTRRREISRTLRAGSCLPPARRGVSCRGITARLRWTGASIR